jgi:hypothetical protein
MNTTTTTTTTAADLATDLAALAQTMADRADRTTTPAAKGAARRAAAYARTLAHAPTPAAAALDAWTADNDALIAWTTEADARAHVAALASLALSASRILRDLGGPDYTARAHSAATRRAEEAGDAAYTAHRLAYAAYTADRVASHA